LKKALLISRPGQHVASLKELLLAEGCEKIVISLSAYSAEETVRDETFDIICINAPLVDENGIALSRRFAGTTRAVIVILVPQKNAGELGALLEPHGILVEAKPVSQRRFRRLLRFANGLCARLLSAQEETERLRDMVQDINMINRAKLLLVTCLNMSEEQAHRYLEKQAMDLRTSKVNVAKQVIQTYEN
jgi:response regulator NasT